MNTWIWIALAAGGVYLLSRGTSATAVPSPEQVRAMTPAQRAEFVKSFQRVLREEGLYEGPIDGISGPNTQRAAQAWLAERPTIAARVASAGEGGEYILVTSILRRLPVERARA